MHGKVTAQFSLRGACQTWSKNALILAKLECEARPRNATQEEDTMLARMIFAILALATVMMSQPHTAKAAPYWPWCSQYGGAMGSPPPPPSSCLAPHHVPSP